MARWRGCQRRLRGELCVSVCARLSRPFRCRFASRRFRRFPTFALLLCYLRFARIAASLSVGFDPRKTPTYLYVPCLYHYVSSSVSVCPLRTSVYCMPTFRPTLFRSIDFYKSSSNELVFACHTMPQWHRRHSGKCHFTYYDLRRSRSGDGATAKYSTTSVLPWVWPSVAKCATPTSSGRPGGAHTRP